jgi:iron complex transport system substrate-binding protein
MRIASLVPSSTEMLFALGLGDSVVAVTHECDYPPEAADLPHLTRSVIEERLSAAEIDREVRERTERGEAIYELDADRLRELEPDLIVTQQVCEVCAVSFDDVTAVARRIPSEPQVLSLDPSTIGEVLADVRTLATAADAVAAGATQLVAGSAVFRNDGNYAAALAELAEGARRDGPRGGGPIDPSGTPSPA